MNDYRRFDCFGDFAQMTVMGDLDA
jgi:hypothetical protein